MRFLKGLVTVGAMGEKPIFHFWNVGDWIVGRVFRMVSKEKNCVGSFFEWCTRLKSKKSGRFCEEISRDQRKLFRWESKICVQQTKSAFPDFRSVEWI